MPRLDFSHFSQVSNSGDKVFDRFYRSPAAVKMASGSGLGLPVVKHLCNIADFTIDFETKHLIGTKVTIHS